MPHTGNRIATISIKPLSRCRCSIGFWAVTVQGGIDAWLRQRPIHPLKPAAILGRFYSNHPSVLGRAYSGPSDRPYCHFQRATAWTRVHFILHVSNDNRKGKLVPSSKALRAHSVLRANWTPTCLKSERLLWARAIVSRTIADRLWLVPLITRVPKRIERIAFPWIATLILTLAILCATSCSEPKLEVFSVLNKARTEDGEPIPGLLILEDGKTRGQTDDAGILFLRIRGFVGQKITLSGVCPKGYRRSSQNRTITLQILAGLNKERIVSGPEVSWRCSSLRQTTALIIRASTQPNLPVAIDGKNVGRTSADGIAHFLLREPAGSRVLVSLDTSNFPELRPQNPQRFFLIKENTAIHIFDQQFTKAPDRKRRRNSKPPPKRYIPYKITD